jgi:hypothetical protein
MSSAEAELVGMCRASMLAVFLPNLITELKRFEERQHAKYSVARQQLSSSLCCRIIKVLVL